MKNVASFHIKAKIRVLVKTERQTRIHYSEWKST